MTNLFTIVTAPLKAIWDAIASVLVDSGVTLAGLILTGIFMAILIGVVTHFSISAGRLKGKIRDE